MLSIERIAVGPFEANCYLIWGQTRRAVVLDPGADAPTILDVIERQRLDVAAYLVSHGHVDHISALAALYEKRPASYALHAADYRWAFSPANQAPPYYLAPQRPASPPHWLKDNQLWTAADLTCRVIVTPGHSAGSLCFYFKNEGILFTGDTLFQRSVGRTDLPGGNSGLLTQSLNVLARLPHATRLYPGHGPPTTLAEELRTNPFLTAYI